MNSSFISMVDKAKRYAEERDRIAFSALEIEFRGYNGTHRVSLQGTDWSCDCEHFRVHSLCAHIMTLQRLFGAHLSLDARYTQERATA